MAEPQIPTNADLNAAVHARLLDRQVPSGRRHLPTYPWATTLLASLSLVEDEVLWGHRWPVEVTLTITRWDPELSVFDLAYTCRLEGLDREGAPWCCEATAATLPRAICLAYIQVRED